MKKHKVFYAAEMLQGTNFWISTQEHTNKKTATKEYNQLKRELKNKPGYYIRLIKYTIETEKKVNSQILKCEYVGIEW